MARWTGTPSEGAAGLLVGEAGAAGGGVGDTADTWDRSAGPAGPAGPAGVVGAAGPVAGAEGIAGIVGFDRGDGPDGGVAEETGGRAAGPGLAGVECVVAGFPEVGAPRPIRLVPPEALRCTGYEPGADGATGGVGEAAAGGVAAGAVAGVPGLLGLGPGAGGFTDAVVPAAALWTTGDVPEGASPAVPTAGPVGRVAGLPLPLPGPGPVVGRTGPGAGLAGLIGLIGVPAGDAVARPESAWARWTLTAAPSERAGVALEPVEPAELVEARWTLVAELPGPVVVPAGVLVGRLGPVVVPAEAVGVRLGSVVARWTWTAELLGAALGPAGVLPGVAAAFWTRTGALPAVDETGGAAAAAAGPVAVVSARAGVVSRGPAVECRPSAVGSPDLVGVAAGVLAVGVGPAVARWTEAGPVAVPLGRVAGPLPLPDGVE